MRKPLALFAAASLSLGVFAYLGYASAAFGKDDEQKYNKDFQPDATALADQFKDLTVVQGDVTNPALMSNWPVNSSSSSSGSTSGSSRGSSNLRSDASGSSSSGLSGSSSSSGGIGSSSSSST